MADETFLFWNGLKKLAAQANGNENVFMGTRPFGFHGGNRWTMVAYPWHLCSQLEKQGRKPRFTFFVSINDMEPHKLKYLYFGRNSEPYYKTPEEMADDEEPPFAYNIFPKKTSFQFTEDPEGCCNSVVDHWEKIIEQEMAFLKRDFPAVKIRAVRNSAIKNRPIFQKVLAQAISNPAMIAETIEKFGAIRIPRQNLFFAGAICPQCRSAQGTTEMQGKKVSFSCDDCKSKSEESPQKLDFWMHHVPLLVPRIILFGIDICIRGGDHHQAKRVEINRLLMEKMGKTGKAPKTLVAPMILSDNGRKMSKSWFNEKDIPIEALLKNAAGWNRENVPLNRLI